MEKSFLFAPLNQNPPHVSERTTLIAWVELLALPGSTRVLRLALACESRVHMPAKTPSRQYRLINCSKDEVGD